MDSGISDTRRSWDAWQMESDKKYAAQLTSLDPAGEGLKITCPDCSATAWVLLPQKRKFENPISIACPTGCGAYYNLSFFSPSASTKSQAGDFDLESECTGDGAIFALNGAIFRCPLCGIENPREVMRSMTDQIRSRCARSVSRDVLSEMLGKIVSTFDGVMRRSNEIAVENHNRLNIEPHPTVNSFQNIAAARVKLLPIFDIASATSDWSAYVCTAQKRHLFSHGLGVVDEKYIKKSGDNSSVLGKQVKLTTEEIVSFAENSESIVRKYFAHCLS